MNRSLLAVTQKAIASSAKRWKTTTAAPFSYHIEVSNLARKNATQIVVTGPGVLGLLASMCVTLATKGGSIKELHAADSLKEGGMPASFNVGVNQKVGKPIRDVITVVDYKTGKAFHDDELHDLAEAVLESTRAPYKVVQAVKQEMDSILSKEELPGDEGYLTVIKGKDKFKHL